MPRHADPNARSLLIAAARHEFVRHGVARARVEDMTAACGMSKGAFYLHFDSKEALFAALVSELRGTLDTLVRGRTEAHERWLASVSAAPGADALPAILAREAEADRAVLELLWEWRDVATVLMRGAQGTPFEGVIWEILDRETKRVEALTDELKHLGLCRSEVSSEITAAMVIGTWLMVLRRMGDLTERPDLDSWVRSVTSLLAEGTRPRIPRRRTTRRRAGPGSRWTRHAQLTVSAKESP